MVREPDERLGFGELIAEHLSDSRCGKNTQFPLADLFRQSVYGRLAGYEDIHDAERLSQDPTFRLIGSETIWDRGAALTSRLQSFETEMPAEATGCGEGLPRAGVCLRSNSKPAEASVDGRGVTAYWIEAETMWRGWFSEPLKPGARAPEFALPDETGRVVRLAELRGRSVVLVFYPGDETPGCRAQLCEFRDKWAAAEKEGVAVFGVNPQSAASHARFRRRHGFPFPLLGDRGQKVARLYQADGPIVRRTVYVIGPDGVIRYARRGRPPVEEVLAAASAARAV